MPIFAATAAIPETTAALKGAAFIRTIQRADGSLSTTPEPNIDAIIALRAAGYDPAKETNAAGKGPIDNLKAYALVNPNSATAAKVALGAKALGLDPKAVNGVDLIAKINAGYDSANGTYGKDDFSQSVAMLGLACTSNTVPAAAVTALKATQITTDGGWGFGGFSDADTTSIAIQALLASGVPKTDTVITKGLAYLKASQGNDGGWGFDPDESNASSTSYVLQALLALGENAESAAYTKGGVNPVGYLLGQQVADGSFKGFDPAYSTNQVIPALMGRTFCNAPETPITRIRPVVLPTATPTTPPPAATTAAPKPPSTGDSVAISRGRQREMGFFALFLMVAGGGLALGLRRGTQR